LFLSFSHKQRSLSLFISSFLFFFFYKFSSLFISIRCLLYDHHMIVLIFYIPVIINIEWIICIEQIPIFDVIPMGLVCVDLVFVVNLHENQYRYQHQLGHLMMIVKNGNYFEVIRDFYYLRIWYSNYYLCVLVFLRFIF